jgi:hypothetical protein
MVIYQILLELIFSLIEFMLIDGKWNLINALMEFMPEDSF